MLGVLTCPPRSSRLLCFSLENIGFGFGDEYGLRLMSKEAFGGLPESFCELQGGPKWSKMEPILDRFDPKVGFESF